MIAVSVLLIRLVAQYEKITTTGVKNVLQTWQILCVCALGLPRQFDCNSYCALLRWDNHERVYLCASCQHVGGSPHVQWIRTVWRLYLAPQPLNGHQVDRISYSWSSRSPAIAHDRELPIPGAAKSNPPKIICCFISNRLEFQCEILHVYVTILPTLKY